MDINIKADGEVRNLLVCFTDIDNFVYITKQYEIRELFRFMNELACLSSDLIYENNGHIIKYIGDSMLIVFPAESINSGVQALLLLKEKLEEVIKAKGFNNTTSFSLHCGPTAIGYLGKREYRSLDVFGNSVQTASVLNGRPKKGNFCVTQQVYDSLDVDLREKFDRRRLPKITVYTLKK